MINENAEKEPISFNCSSSGILRTLFSNNLNKFFDEYSKDEIRVLLEEHKSMYSLSEISSILSRIKNNYENLKKDLSEIWIR